jgi:hypothetical protein
MFFCLANFGAVVTQKINKEINLNAKVAIF